MKKIHALTASVALLTAASAFAGFPGFQPGPIVEPGPVQEAGAEAVNVARLLLDTQLKDCVADFQRDDVAISKVTRQVVSPEQTTYEVRGVMLVGGDVAVGDIVLTVDETEVPAPLGFGKALKRTCTVIRAKSS